MAEKTVRLQFDTALTDGSGEKIRSQLASILKGIGEEGFELQSVKVSQSAISSLRSQIQNGLKDIPITFKASDIATSTGVIAANAGSALKPARKEIEDLLKQYERAMSGWQKARLGGNNNQAANFAKEAKDIAAQYKQVAAANKGLISQEDALSKLAEKRKQIVNQTVAALRDQRQQQKQAAEEQAAKQREAATANAAKQRTAESTAAAKQQVEIQKELDRMLKQYASTEAKAQKAALTGKGDASGLAQQAKEQAEAYERLAQSLDTVQSKQQAYNNLAQTQASIIRQTTSALQEQESKQQSKQQTDLDKALAAYAKAEERAQKARVRGDEVGYTSASADATQKAEAYRQLAESIEDVSQREEALNALQQTHDGLVDAATATIERNTEAERENARAKEEKAQTSQMTASIDSQISRLGSLTSALLRNTQAYRDWQAAQAAYKSGAGTFDQLQAAGSKLQELLNGLAPAGKNLGTVLSPLFARLSGRLNMAAWAAATKAIRDMMSAVKELDASLTQMQIVTGGTDDDIEKFGMNIAQTAKNIGSSITDLVDSATVFARLGYSESESSSLAKFTSMLSNVGDIDVSTAQNALTSIVKAYGQGVDDIEGIMDKMVAVGKEIAQGCGNAA